jgi:hypothetical protein
MLLKVLPNLKLQNVYKKSFADRWESFDRDEKRLKTKRLNDALETARTESLCRNSMNDEYRLSASGREACWG